MGDCLGSPRIPMLGRKPAIPRKGRVTAWEVLVFPFKLGDCLGSPCIPFLAYPNLFGSEGGGGGGRRRISLGNLKFPRMNTWDPYKRLGIPPDASIEEMWGSRNFLLEQYAGHERSAESIEAAFEKLLMTSFNEMKKTRYNMKIRLKKKVEEPPSWLKNLFSFIEVPATEVIFRRLFLFAFMVGWSIMNSTEAGPVFR